MALTFLWNNSRMLLWARCAWHFVCRVYYAAALWSLYRRGYVAGADFAVAFNAWRHHTHEYEQLEKRL